ncbi:MAG TPA: hypothetical protein VKI20_07485, partial [Acidimicrobiales bacterium]|nr:hypothetical protein [Acidimicrobiales bacterium]
RLVSAYLGTDQSVVERSGAGVMAGAPPRDAARRPRKPAAKRRSRVEGGKVAAPVAGAARRAAPKKAAAKSAGTKKTASTSNRSRSQVSGAAPMETAEPERTPRQRDRAKGRS